MLLRQLFDHASSTYTYLLASAPGREALIIDPVKEQLAAYLRLIEELDLKLVRAIDTHTHADHITALGDLRDRTQCVTLMGEFTKAKCVSEQVRDGDCIDVDGLRLQAMYTPGHTDESFSFQLDRGGPAMVFTGDVLLIRGTGRTDFQGGDPHKSWDSIVNRLFRLDDDTVVYPAHDYKGWTTSTIGEEKRCNPRLAGKSEAEYVAIMKALKLPDPTLMDVAVRSNLFLRQALMSWLRVPLFEHLREPGRPQLFDDLVAGAITAVLLVPQGMAYALLAGLPPELGLYASILPPIVYALFGTSRALAVGPVAVASLMVATALAGHAQGDPARWLTGAMILAFEGGVLLLLMGMLRLGALVNFISHPVLNGFTTGAALLIVINQVPALSGISVPAGSASQTLAGLWSERNELSLVTLACAGVALVALLLARQPLANWLQRRGLSARHSLMLTRLAPLTIVLCATALAAATEAGAAGLRLVGPIPAGLPTPSLAFLAADGWLELAGPAVLIALIGYVEGISVARALAARRRQKIDADQELKALGLANIGAAVVGSLPVAGGFSRSMVNFDAGAQTQRASMITALLVAVVALLFAGWFQYLPRTVLAAIIVVAVWQLVDLGSLRRNLAYDRADGASQLATLVGVLLLGIEPGLVMGMALSLCLYLWRTSQPHIAVLGRVPGSEHFRNVLRHTVETLPTALFVRSDENLYFANAGAVERFITARVADAPGLSDVVLVMSAVNYVDASGLDMLVNLRDDLERAGVRLHLAEVKGPVMDRLAGTALLNPDTPIHLSTARAYDGLA